MAGIPEATEFTLSSTGSRRLRSWLTRHLQTFFYTLGLLSRAPLASFLTAAVIGMALALPAGLYVLLENVQDATRGWDGSNAISLFLELDVTIPKGQFKVRTDAFLEMISADDLF